MEVFLGVILGILWVVSILVAFMIGYGWNKQTNDDE